MSNSEGNLEASTPHPLDWKSDNFYDEDSLNKKLERVFDICHGFRRCVSLCGTFPTLFDWLMPRRRWKLTASIKGLLEGRRPMLFMQRIAEAGLKKPELAHPLALLTKAHDL